MISASDLLITPEGRVYHLNLLPSEVARKVIVVGDPSRVAMISQFLDSIEVEVSHREFTTVTGYYKGERLTIMSSGISSDNIDILLNELDALYNIDFETRQIKSELVSAEILRIGTCGVLQESIRLGDFIISDFSIGLDGVVNFYKGSHSVRECAIEHDFVAQTAWDNELPTPYVVRSSRELSDRFRDFTVSGFTACGGGFFGPQGRVLRLEPVIDNMVDKIVDFDHYGLKITNFEMEGAALGGLAAMMGHKATTICLGIAHRCQKSANVDYGVKMKELIKRCLDNF